MRLSTLQCSYLDQPTRNFLIKMAVNFVHDLYKPNVRGYQVTQCRTKAYGNKVIRQFKLERWMDYGPTIAAAFGAYDPKEVDELRQALVECMRNTPLNSGIRATGAVRQSQDEGGTFVSRVFGLHVLYFSSTQRVVIYDKCADERSSKSQEDYGRVDHDSKDNGSQNGAGAGGGDATSVVEEADLLGVENWNDISQQQSSQQQQHQQYGQRVPHGNPYGVPLTGAPPHPYQQQQPPQQQYGGMPPHQQAYQDNMVTAAPSQGYPGAPDMGYSAEPWSQQQQPQQPHPLYPGQQQQQQAYGGPPPQQHYQPAF
jgi:hypothetical protein